MTGGLIPPHDSIDSAARDIEKQLGTIGAILVDMLKLTALRLWADIDVQEMGGTKDEPGEGVEYTLNGKSIPPAVVATLESLIMSDVPTAGDADAGTNDDEIDFRNIDEADGEIDLSRIL